MKRIIAVMMAVLLVLAFCACKKEKKEVETEALTAQESQLVEYIIKIAMDEFSDASSVRVLNIGDYLERSKNEPESYDYGPDTVVVQLMGTSNDTGNSNPHFRICLTTTKNTYVDYSVYVKSAGLYALSGDKASRTTASNKVMDYVGEAGEYLEMNGAYRMKPETEKFSISRINNGIKEHWDNLGF